MIYSDNKVELLFPQRRWNRLTLTLEGEIDILDVISIRGEEQQSLIQWLNIPQTIFGSGVYQFQLLPKLCIDTVIEWLESDCLQIICSNPQAIIAIELEYVCEAVEQEKQARITGDEQLATSIAVLSTQKEDKQNKVISWDQPDNIQYPSAKLVYDSLRAEETARCATDQVLHSRLNTLQNVVATKENSSNKVTSWNNPTDQQYPSAKLVYDTIQNSGAGPHKLDGSGHLEPDDTTTFDATTDHHGLMPKLSGNEYDIITGTGQWIDIRNCHRLDEHAQPIDNTNLNATTNAHGLMPKLSGNSGHVMCGDGQWRNYANYWDTLQFTPPQLSQFSWVNQRNVTTRDANGAVVMYAPAPGKTGDKWSLLVTPLQSQIFDAVVGFSTVYINLSLCGLVLFNSNSNKFTAVSLRNDLLTEVTQWNSVTSWGGTPFSVNIRNVCGVVYLRVVQTNNSQRVFYISHNGVDWIQLWSTTNTDWIVPTHIGFGINPYNSSYAQCATFVHWQVNY